MEDSRQTKGTVLSWTLIGVAFVIIIFFLLGKFLKEGKENAISNTQDKIINFADTWATQLNDETKMLGECGVVFGAFVEKEGYKIGDTYTRAYGKALVENTDICQVVFCNRDRVICDEKGDRVNGIDLSCFLEDEVEQYHILTGIEGYEDSDVVASYTSVGEMGDYILCLIKLSDISNRFPISAYEEVSCLSIVKKEGDVLGNFGKYKDTDSRFLSSGNVLDCIASGSTEKETFNIFKVKLYNGIGSAIQATYEEDARTFAFIPVGISDWYLSFGIRQTYVDRLINAEFSDVRSTVIKLGVVTAVFVVFVVSTIVFNSLRNKERGRALEDKADTDLLTELNNKAATERKIQEYMADNPNGRAMMFILDIDNFKKINDTMGHAFGDTLLKTLGKEIKTEFRMTDIIGRTGGDEFMVFLKDVTDDLIVEREANRITRFFHDFKAGGDYVKYSASASIGAAIYPDDAKTFKDLYVAADQALYRAKKRGKNQLVFYNEEAHK